MKIEYTNHHNIAMDFSTVEQNGGLMLTATYICPSMQPEVPLINGHSWAGNPRTLHVSIHHVGLEGFEHKPDGNDMVSLTAETEDEAYWLNARLFCHINQMLMLPTEAT